MIYGTCSLTKDFWKLLGSLGPTRAPAPAPVGVLGAKVGAAKRSKGRRDLASAGHGCGVPKPNPCGSKISQLKSECVYIYIHIDT